MMLGHYKVVEICQKDQGNPTAAIRRHSDIQQYTQIRFSTVPNRDVSFLVQIVYFDKAKVEAIVSIPGE